VGLVRHDLMELLDSNREMLYHAWKQQMDMSCFQDRLLLETGQLRNPVSPFYRKTPANRELRQTSWPLGLSTIDMGFCECHCHTV
jgi:hypothetical protein